MQFIKHSATTVGTLINMAKALSNYQPSPMFNDLAMSHFASHATTASCHSGVAISCSSRTLVLLAVRVRKPCQMLKLMVAKGDANIELEQFRYLTLLHFQCYSL